jgi:hypothetical protein
VETIIGGFAFFAMMAANLFVVVTLNDARADAAREERAPAPRPDAAPAPAQVGGHLRTA